MDDAGRVLKLIESVGASTSQDLLDEIDACESRVFGAPLARYTRSRDALKPIRPAGPTFSMLACTEGYRCLSERGVRPTPYCFTEELAELHAIIQTVAARPAGPAAS